MLMVQHIPAFSVLVGLFFTVNWLESKFLNVSINFRLPSNRNNEFYQAGCSWQTRSSPLTSFGIIFVINEGCEVILNDHILKHSPAIHQHAC